MFPLHSIVRTCRIPGGLKTLKLIAPEDLATQPAWNISQDAGELDFLPGKSAFFIEQDFRSARLEGDHNISTPAGDFFQYNLTAQHRAIRATVESLRAKLTNRRVHVVATYMDGLQRLVPYMRLAIKDDSGARRSDKQGYTIQGTTRLLMPGPGIGGNIATIPPPVGTPGESTTAAGTEIITATITTSTYTYLIPAGSWLVGWEVRSTSSCECSLGFTAGGTELGGPVPLPNLQVWVGQGNMVPTFTDTYIYFSGLAGTTSIKIWLLSEL